MSFYILNYTSKIMKKQEILVQATTIPYLFSKETQPQLETSISSWPLLYKQNHFYDTIQKLKNLYLYCSFHNNTHTHTHQTILHQTDTNIDFNPILTDDIYFTMNT